MSDEASIAGLPAYKRAAVAALVPYARNSRTHSAAQVDKIAASIREFGFLNPVITDGSNGIIAGHGRILAAQKLGIDEVPTIDAAHLTDAQRRAYIIADNRLALDAGWDDEMLRVELGDLQANGFDLALTGFNLDEISALMADDATVGLTDEDAVPDAPEVPTTVLGDVWLLGRHRLMCGDSTSIDAVDKLMDGGKADMVFTDPPYGMTYGGGRAGKIGSNDGTVKKHGVIKGDDLRGEELIRMIRDAVGSAISASKSGAAKYVCFPWRTYAEFEAALEQVGMTVSACIVWDKKSIGLGNSNYRPQHEFIFYSKGDSWHGDKAQSDVWYNSRGATGAYVHPTQKPVELVEKAIRNSSKGQDVVIDVFGGSGSTLIACEKTARDGRMMELDPKYCDVIITRWQDFTGLAATLEGIGQTYAEVTSNGRS
jgi:DNA modification methylase